MAKLIMTVTAQQILGTEISTSKITHIRSFNHKFRAI